MATRKKPSTGMKPDKLMHQALMLELHQTVDMLDPAGTGRKLKIKRLRLVAVALVNAALKGDIGAIKEINERIDGRVPTELRGGGKNGSFDFNFNDIRKMNTDDLNAFAERLARED